MEEKDLHDLFGARFTPLVQRFQKSQEKNAASADIAASLLKSAFSGRHYIVVHKFCDLFSATQA
ncbi:hypothetical protein J8I26_00330 [Herbaspirillum sp. LeCh32-8]|uniref:hypothetical protein n=1 Tax=Herbaspirillum sp. LeCh32-8 TaxID=2821356 RepID=UPI001AE4B277|nr:hypothetical protein [Herbaspirillum sp. LeCh32-8]MBP0596539.1 hypothetical protein [Herbaspirillum sp. LeCh32-8]